jgi:hypothetical protein
LKEPEADDVAEPAAQSSGPDLAAEPADPIDTEPPPVQEPTPIAEPFTPPVQETAPPSPAAPEPPPAAAQTPPPRGDAAEEGFSASVLWNQLRKAPAPAAFFAGIMFAWTFLRRGRRPRE